MFAVLLLLPAAGIRAEPVGDAAAVAPADSPTALARRFPILDTDSVTCPPFLATGQVRLDNGGYQLAVRYRRPREFETLATDARDNSPFAVCQGQTLYIFDPSTPQFVMTPDLKLQWSLAGGRGNALNFDFRFDTNRNFTDRVFIDIPSMLTSAVGELTDAGSTAETISLVHAGKTGKRLAAELHHRLREPVCTLRLFDPGEDQPRVVITVTLHAAGSQPLVQLPSPEAVAKVLPVHSLPENAGANDMLQMVMLCWRGLAGNLGAWDESMRDTFQGASDKDVDWDAIAGHKRSHGPAIRALFAIPAPLNPDELPITPQLAADEADAAR